MAKGQMRSNREAKKPKAVKKPTAPAAGVPQTASRTPPAKGGGK